MLYQLDSTTKCDYKKVKRVTLNDAKWCEQDLENLISTHIEDLISTNALMTIFTQRPWKEEPDILAIDKKGDLYIFELKRWQSNSENLLQVLRYGQLYGNSIYSELDDLYQKRNPGRSLQDAHKAYFQLDNNIDKQDFNQKQHFLIVTNGLDQKTIESIIYWKRNGLSIDGIVYWVFEINNDYYIEFNMYSPLENQLEYDNSCYILNTNFTNSKQSHNDMLQENKAAAYCTGWKEKIGKFQKDDLIFLYQTNVGIVAFGKADGKLQKKAWNGVADDEYFMKLNEFKSLKKPMKAAEMKRVAQRGFPFRTTLFSIDEETGKLLLNEMKKSNL